MISIKITKDILSISGRFLGSSTTIFQLYTMWRRMAGMRKMNQKN